jgi:hypothetical protein
MFGTNKLCMKGIYLPTFQRSIILRGNEGYKTFTQFEFSEEKFPKKFASLLACVEVGEGWP